MQPATRDRILRSRFLPLLVFPLRVKTAVRELSRSSYQITRWLFHSREFANYSYQIQERNLNELFGFIASITGVPISTVAEYANEIMSDKDLLLRVDARLRDAGRRREFDQRISLGRRVGWYVFVRILEPEVVVETGTEKGLGSVVIAEALLRNGHGRLYTLDIESSSGLIFKDDKRYHDVIKHRIGDSITLLNELNETVDVFLHDSDHSAEHERREFEAVRPLLAAHGVVLSDNSHVTQELFRWAQASGLNFLYFQEHPVMHWYRGAGIGCAWKPAD